MLLLVVGLENVCNNDSLAITSEYLIKINEKKKEEEKKHTVNDKRSPVEENTRHLVGVRSEFLAGKQAIEDQARVGETGGLDGQRRDGAAVGGISCA